MPSEDFLTARRKHLVAIGKEHLIPLDNRMFDDNDERIEHEGGGLSDPEWVERELKKLDAETWPPKT